MQHDMVQNSLHDELVSNGFELLETGGNLYRVYVPSFVEEDQYHPVFLSLSDSEVQAMSAFGEESEVNVDDLELLREPDDGYEIVIVAGNGAFTRGISLQEAQGNFDSILGLAVNVGVYANSMQHRLAQRQIDKDEVLARLQHLCDSENWDLINSGAASAESFIQDAELALTLMPKEGLWQTLSDTANRASIWAWANDPDGRSMTTLPWSMIADRLRDYGAARGWKHT